MGEKVIAVLQARCGSTRLPNKVLAPLLGVPMIRRIYERVSHAESVDKVMVSTTMQREDDAIADVFAEKPRVLCYRWSGHVDDIVGRLLECAILHEAELVVRVWGDCPLVDPELIDDTIRNGTSGADYALPGSMAGLGFDVYRTSFLKTIARGEDARTYPFIAAERTNNLRRYEWASGYCLAVDYSDDLHRTRMIYRLLHHDHAPPFSMREVLSLPADILAIGQEHERNAEFLEAVT